MSRQRILVVRTDRLGDTVLTLPVAADLRAALPDAELTLLCAPALAGLAACDRNLDAVLTWRQGTSTRPIARRIATAGFAATVVCYTRFPLVWTLRRSGIPLRAGSGRRLYSPLLNLRDFTSRSASGRHECEGSRAFVRLLLARLGADVAVCDRLPTTGLTLPAAACERAEHLWAELATAAPVVVLQPGSGGSSLDWPLAHMCELADRLRTAGRTVLVHCGPGEEGLAASFPSHRSVGADLDLVELGAVLARADVLVGGSTGPLHLAAALGTPVVGLYPPVRALGPERWGPLGSAHRCLVPPDAPVYAERTDAPPDVMAGIGVDAVIRAVDGILDDDE